MMKVFKRSFAVAVSMALLLTAFCAALPMVSSATTETAITYEKQISPNAYESIAATNGGAVKLVKKNQVSGVPAGWCLTDESSHLVSGEIVYKVDAALKDVRFHSAYQTPAGWHNSPLEFYASEDGVVWTVLNQFKNASTTLGNVDGNTTNFPNVYVSVYDAASFDETENIRYLKVVTKIKSGTPNNDRGDYIPRVFGIDYNAYGETGMLSSYNVNWGASSTSAPYYAETATGDLTATRLQHSWEDSGWTNSLADTMKGDDTYLRGTVSYGNVGNGTVSMYFTDNQKVITDYCVIGAFWDLASYTDTQVEVFGTTEAFDKATVASVEWKKLSFAYDKTTYKMGNNVPANCTASYMTKLYGKLAATEGIRALKITLTTPKELVAYHEANNNGNDGWQFGSFGLNSVSFNTVAAEMKDSYTNNWGAGSTATTAPCMAGKGYNGAGTPLQNWGNLEVKFSKNGTDFTNSISDTMVGTDLCLRSGMIYDKQNSADMHCAYFFKADGAITDFKIVAALFDDYNTAEEVHVYGTTEAVAADNVDDVTWKRLNYIAENTGYIKGNNAIYHLYGNISAAANIQALKVSIYNAGDISKQGQVKPGDYYWDRYGLNSVSFNTVADDTAAAVTDNKATPSNADAVLGYVKTLSNPTEAQVSLALAAAYAKAADKTVTAGALTPSYTTTTMSVNTTQTLRYRFEAKELLYAAKAAALPGAEYKFGVLYVGRNATKEQMLTLTDNANYYAEVTVDASTVYAGNGELSVNITRGRADVGQRDTLLPYLKVTVGGNTYTYYADDVTKQSPVGWMKKAMQNVSGSAIEETYNAKVEELAKSETYKDIENFSDMLTSIAQSANQTGALEGMNTAKSGFGTQENYYALMKALFEVV